MKGYLGEIRAVAFNYAPPNWAFCDGTILNIADNNQALFAILGCTYGGDGRKTFALPDFRGRVPIQAGNSKTLGAPNIQTGYRGGEVNHKLTTNEIPAHNHNVDSTITITGNIGACADDGSNLPTPDGANPSLGLQMYHPTGDKPMAAGQVTTGGSASFDKKGGDAPHYNMQPYIVFNYLICISGDFPNRG